ncbi:MOSC domain-containing protein [Cellulosimicrobium marinum]|uniref:MOSC domain-containing protein n=1 Tax=Cellulosimicrobium marinum TaxID=1638992 RepID=UPI001E5B85D7|nr:MOSC domain-containing protein [Cellulosimicrobium marinum]MCB7136078.1 MOSC domain-containing protein [Cellulosimicrobium marinum]
MTTAAPATELASSALTGTLLAVCRVHGLLPDAGTVGVTAIDKRPVDGPVKARRLGLYADVQADRANHGGADQAVYAYGQDDADWWAGELGRDVPPGLFGENLRVQGIPVSGALVGERWSVGTALLEVTQPRTPCATFARRLDEAGWVKRFTVANRTGAYLRVVRPGEVRAGDTVTVCYRPEHGVGLADWFGAWTTRGADPARAAGLAQALLAAHLGGDVTLTDEMLARAETAAGRRIED